MFTIFNYSYWWPEIEEMNPNEHTILVLNRELKEREKPLRISQDPFLNELKDKLSQPNLGLKDTNRKVLLDSI